MSFKDVLSTASLVVGLVLSAINVYLFFNGHSAREVERLKAQLELLDLKPSFDVTYYGVARTNPLAFALFDNGDKADIQHPLATAKLIRPLKGGQFFVPDDSAVYPESVVHRHASQSGEADYDTVDCAYQIFYFKYTGAPRLKKVVVGFDMVEGKDGMAPSLDEIQYPENSYEDVVKDYKRLPQQVELAGVEKGDAFYVPMTLECNAARASDGGWLQFSYPAIGVPVDIAYDNPLDGSSEKLEVRAALKNIIVNEAGITERG